MKDLNRLKKIIIVLYLATLHIAEIQGQTVDDRTTFHLKEEILSFLDRVGHETIGKHRIFAIYVFKVDTSENSFCFSMSYFYNTYEYNNFSPKYFFTINDEIFTIINEEPNEVQIFNIFKPHVIEKTQEDLIMKKLHDNIMYRPMAMQYCWEFNFYELKIFQNGNWVPVEESIYYKYYNKNKPND
jgi:hypothetical protein